MNFLRGRCVNFHQVSLCLLLTLTVLLFILNLCTANPQTNYHWEQNRFEYDKEPRPDGYYTIYGETCKDRCRNDGTNYYWCYKKGESGWDYCSPYYDTTRYGRRCHSSCGQFGKYYYWCYDLSGSWDYCSPIRNKV